MSDSTAPRRAKRRFSTPVIVAGGLSSLLLAFSFTPTFSALTAAITNTDNTAGTGSLVMRESNSAGTVTCTTDGNGTATCAGINKFGGTSNLLAPGGAHQTVAVDIANIGSIDAATFTLAGATCSTADGAGSSHGTGDLCTKLNIKITRGGTTVFEGTGAQLAAASPISLAPMAHGASATFTFDVSFPTYVSGPVDNTFQGRVMSQQLVWTFQS